MKPQVKAEKELAVMKWMQEKGYDRKASQEVAPIIVKYIHDRYGEDECVHPFKSIISAAGKSFCCKCDRYIN